MNDEYNYAIGFDRAGYIFKCSECGRNVGGYKRKKLKGKVRCSRCYKAYHAGATLAARAKDYDAGRADTLEEALGLQIEVIDPDGNRIKAVRTEDLLKMWEA